MSDPIVQRPNGPGTCIYCGRPINSPDVKPIWPEPTSSDSDQIPLGHRRCQESQDSTFHDTRNRTF